MSDLSGIEWTRSTWNPTVGCSLMSPGCTNCYAMHFAHRLSTSFGNAAGRKYKGLTRKVKGNPVWTGVVRTADEALEIPLGWRKPRLVFVNSMSDLFHESLPTNAVDRVFAVMGLAGQHIFQLLTKRPDRMRDYLNDPETEARVRREAGLIRPGAGIATWPLKNVWCGTSIEDQTRANERISQLLAAKAHTRFLSIEPLLGPIVLREAASRRQLMPRTARSGIRTGIHWAIVGGESGHKARPMHPAWARALRDECLALKIPFFFKQVGQWGWHDIGRKRRTIGLLPDGRIVPVGTKGATTLYSLGKKASGKLLDGQVLQDYPADGRALAMASRMSARPRLPAARRAA